MRTMSPLIFGNEENVPVLKNKNQTLPPNVFGDSRGFLDLSVDRIQWNVTAYPGVNIRVLWWGESYDDAATIQFSSTPSSRNSVNYKVCTNTKLFHKYLSSCEAIELQFTSISNGLKTQGRQIGTAFISIPQEILAQDKDLFAPVIYTNTHKIFSPKNAIVGMVKVTLKLVLFDDLTKGDLDPLTERNESRNSVKNYLSYTKERLPMRSVSRESNRNTSSKVWSFLKGKDMTPRDEASTLVELTQSSPANSVIEAMDEELTWKLRDIYAKKEKLFRSHNPGSSSDDRPTKENGHTNETHNGTPNNRETRNGNPSAESPSNGHNEDPLTERNSVHPAVPADEDYQGVFYIGGFRNQHPHNRVPNVFAIAKSISNVDDALMKTNLSDQNLFVNYLKLFNVNIEPSYLDAQMKQNTLSVELWTRYATEQDVKLGSASVSLHPFYVAFRSDVVRHRLFDLSMPVIAVDGWTMVQAADGSAIGQLEIILAMGTKRQIEYFVQTKDLLNRKPIETSPVSVRSPETATSILSSFLDNLSQQMAANKAQLGTTGQMRKTSDLLDVLQKSLASPPSREMINGFSMPTAGPPARDATDAKAGARGDYVKISLEIESAMHLPKVVMKTGLGKKGQSGDVEQEPSSYVTFEAKQTDGESHELIDSVEGKVFATTVVSRSSNPTWNQKFTVEIPKDLLTHPEKYFIVKIWRKSVVEIGDPKPTPLSDAVIGFCTVDLKVLTAGLPEIAGCYNIVYFDGKCNGQLQLKLKPLEAIQHRDVLDTAEMEQPKHEKLTLPMLDLSLGAPDLSLSRTLKRKFTELDEITERLRARLHDVTSSELISSDDEFENYLNNSVDEVDEDEHKDAEETGDVVDAVKCDDFNWLGNLTDMQRQFVEIDRQLQKNSQTLNELLDRNAMPGTSTAQSVNSYTNGVGGTNPLPASVESLETALKDAVLTDRSKAPSQ